MSTLMQLTHELNTHVLTAVQAEPAPSEGILDWLTAKNTQTQGVLRAMSITLGILFVIMNAVAARGAMARVIIAALAAGVFVWVVFSITDIKDRVDSEVSLGPVVTQVHCGLVPPVGHAFVPATT